MSYNDCNVESEISKIYLFVPYNYKDEIKLKGGRWDAAKKQWYIYSNNKNKDDLVDMYNMSNFRSNRNGYVFVGGTKEREQREQNEKLEHDKLLRKWINDGNKESDFGEWYSVNVLNHD